MRALLRDAEDQTLIALEAEEAVYDPEDQLLLLYAASGTNYEVSRIVRAQCRFHDQGVGRERVL